MKGKDYAANRFSFFQSLKSSCFERKHSISPALPHNLTHSRDNAGIHKFFGPRLLSVGKGIFVEIFRKRSESKITPFML